LKHYGSSCTIVFDGYDSGPSIKDHEHQRRATRTAPSIQVSGTNQICHSQSTFLTNAFNKSQFIALLVDQLKVVAVTAKQSAADADTDIVQAAIELATRQQPAIVVADDTDVLCLLTHHLKSNMADVYMLLSRRSIKNKSGKLVSIRKVQSTIGTQAVGQLLVLHALTGCDTTSAPFGIGKVTAFKKVTKDSNTVALTNVIGSNTATRDAVADAGSKLLVMLYGGRSQDTLDLLRYNTYMSMCALRSARLAPERLPPTERAAFYHCLRVHLQVVQWSSLMSEAINAVEWGWQVDDGSLKPIPTDQKPAPDDLLKFIKCSCKSETRNQCGENSNCTCRKNGLPCVPACGNCRGDSCSNAERIQTSNDSDASNSDADIGQDMQTTIDELIADEDLPWNEEEEVIGMMQ